MNDSRREFLKKAALVTGGASIWSSMPMAVQRAMAIQAAPGTTFYDAEHVVMLMQENRSFDHCFGTMKGVRGFLEPSLFQTKIQFGFSRIKKEIALPLFALTSKTQMLPGWAARHILGKIKWMPEMTENITIG